MAFFNSKNDLSPEPYDTDPFYKKSSEPRDFTLPEEEEDDSFEFVKGIKSGVDQTQALAGGLKAAVGSAVGNREWVDDGLDYYRQQMDEASQYAPRTAFEDEWGEDGWVDQFTDFTDWLSFTAGNLVPSMVGMIGTGGFGGAVAGGVAKVATTAAVKKSMRDRMQDAAQGVAENQVLRESQKRYVGLVAKKYSKIGTVTGGAAFSAGAGVGESFGRIVEETGLEDPATAFSAGIAMGAMDLIGVPFRAFRKMFPDESLDAIRNDLAEEALNERSTIRKMFDRVITPETRLQAVGSEALKSGVLEGVTEVAQEGLSRLGVKWASKNLSEEDQEKFEGYMFGEDAISSYIHAMAAGAVGGTFMGGITGAAAGPTVLRENPLIAEDDDEGDGPPTAPPTDGTAPPPDATAPPTDPETPTFSVEQERERERIILEQRQRASEAYEDAQNNPGREPLPEAMEIKLQNTVENMPFVTGEKSLENLAEANGIDRGEQLEILEVLEEEGRIIVDRTGEVATYELVQQDAPQEQASSPVVEDRFADLTGLEKELARFNEPTDGLDVAASGIVNQSPGDLTSTLPVAGDFDPTDAPIDQQVADINNQTAGPTPQPNGDDSITQQGMPTFGALVQKLSGVGSTAPKDTVGGKQSDDDLLSIVESFGATDVENSPELKTFTSVLVEAIRRGLPRAALDSVSGFYGFDGLPAEGNPTYVPAAYSNSTNTVVVNKAFIREAATNPVAKKQLLFAVTHELYHALDAAKQFSTEMLGMRVELTRVDGEIRMDLDSLTGEMYGAYAADNDLGKVFKYPFDTLANYLENQVGGNLEAGAKMMRIELFAQAGAVFTNNPKLLKKFAPQTYKMMQDIHADSRSLTERRNASNTQSKDAADGERAEVQGDVQPPTVDRGDEASDTGESGRDSEEGGGQGGTDTGVAGQGDNQDGDGDGRTLSVKEQFENQQGLDEITPNDSRVDGPNTSRADEGRADDETEANAEQQKRELEQQIADTKEDGSSEEETVRETQSSVEGLQPIQLPVDELSLSQDVPQFKTGANDQGVVERLGGTFDSTGVGPILVWERNDGRKEIISGRHRFELAKRSGEKTILSQVFREADGFNVQDAQIMDAELNLRDEQGQVKDYVNYFKATKFSKEEANSRGLLARATGKRAYAIATGGSDELITAHRNDQITDAEAEAVALNAPGNTALQAAGLKALIDGSKAIEAVNVMKAIEAVDPNAGGAGQQDSMFAFDDSAMQTATAMSKIVSKKQREITADLSAITGASKKPEVASKYGVDVKDANALKAVIDGLKADRVAWENWHTNPELIAEINSEMNGEPDLLSMVVSTRFPTAVRNTEDPVNNTLVNSYDSFVDSPVFSKNMILVKKYTNLTKQESIKKDTDAAEALIEHAKANLLYLFDLVPKKTRARSKLWYVGANKIANDLAKKYSRGNEQVTLAQTSAVLANLSPQKDWYMNADLGRRVMEVYHDKFDQDFDASMSAKAKQIYFSGSAKAKKENKEMLATIGTRSMEEIWIDQSLNDIEKNRLTAFWIRTYDETYNDRSYPIVSPEGKMLKNAQNIDGSNSKVAWGSLNEISKAVSVLRNGAQDNITTSLGAANKVRNFYNNIFDPKSQSGFVTIDTHAVAASLLKPLSGNSLEVAHNFGGQHEKGQPGASNSSVTGHNGTYSIYEEAYRRAAKDRKVLPREMQSITWEAVRGLFSPAYKSNEENVNYVESVWMQYRNNKIDISKARSLVYEHAERIQPPTWDGPNTRLYDSQRQKNRQGDVSGNGVPRQGSGPNTVTDAGRGTDDTGVSPAQLTRPSQAPEPDLQNAVQARIDRQITAQELNEIQAEKGRFVQSLTREQAEKIITLPSDAKSINALRKTSREKTGKPSKETFFNAADLSPGQRVAGRLDIPANNPDNNQLSADEKTSVVTIHEPRVNPNAGAAGTRLGYAKTLRMTNGVFGVNQKAAAGVGTGKKSKTTFATIEGGYVPATNEENLAAFLDAIDDPEWTQVSMNPRKHSHFYRLDDQYPVVTFEDVIQVGNFVIAKNVNKANLPEVDDFLYMKLEGRHTPGIAFNLNDEVLAERQTSTWLTKYFPRKLIAAVQDKFERWETVENSMAATLGKDKLGAEESFRDQENLMHSKLQKMLEDFGEEYITPLADLAKEYGLSADQIGAYLLAKHAPERNAEIKKQELEKREVAIAALQKAIEESESIATTTTLEGKLEILEEAPLRFQDNGSGVSNTEAAELLSAAEEAGTASQFEEIATQVYKMLDDMRQNMVDKGLLDEESKRDWEETYEFYVPLRGFREPADSIVPGGSGAKGFSITGPESMKARGRLSLPENPLLMAFKNAGEKIIRAEKNVVAQRLLKLVERFDSTDQRTGWTVYNNKFRAPYPKGSKEDLLGETMPLRDMQNAKMLEYPNLPRFVQVKRGGQTFFIEFRDPVLNAQLHDANSMTLNSGNEVLDGIFKTGRAINNFRRKMIINYNPSWGLVNPMRDVETGLAFLLAEQNKVGGRVKDKDLVANVFLGFKASFKAYYDHERNKEPNSEKQKEIFKYIDEYIADGAPTGLATIKDLEELRKDFEKELGPQPIKIGNLNIPSAIDTRVKFGKYFDAATDWVEAFNQSSENAIRLSTYMEARKAGIARQEAATLAKDLTTNFNRKGEYSSQIDSLYLFFNAAIQGNVNLKDALVGAAAPGDKAKLLGIAATRRLFFGLVAFGISRTIMNFMFADEDEDGESKYNDYNPYQLQTSATFMGGDWAFGVPLPYGWGWADNIGRLLGEQLMGAKEPEQAAVEALNVTLHHFSPRGFHAVKDDTDSLGNTFQAAITLTPDVGAFFIEQAGNVNFFGSPIVMPTPYTDQPSSSDGASKRSTMEGFKSFAKAINSLTGGSQQVSGAIDMSPDRLQHIFDFALGGLGRFGTDVADTIQKTAIPKGEELKGTDIPIWSRFYYNPSEYKDQFEYYDNRRELGQEMDGWDAANSQSRETLTKNRSRQYYTQLNANRKATDKKLKKNRKEIRAVESAIDTATGDYVARLLERKKKLKTDNELLYDRFNKRYRQLK